jgi:hypothetical protein
VLWPKADLKTQFLLFAVFAVLVGPTLLGAIFGGPDIRPEQTLAEFSTAIRDNRLTVIVESQSDNPKGWSVVLDDAQRADFVAAASHADLGHATSHCVSIHHAKVQLQVGADHLKYFSTVCKQETEPLILTKIVEVVDEDGNRRSLQYPGVRIPNLGAWMLRAAPKGGQ